MYKVQSVLIRKYDDKGNDVYDLGRAVNFVLRNGFKVKKVDETRNFFRFRQEDPSVLRKEGYQHFVNKGIIDNVSLILAYKKS